MSKSMSDIVSEFEVKIDDDNETYYFYKKPIKIIVYSNDNLNFDFIIDFYYKYRIWLNYSNIININNIGKADNEYNIDICSTFFSKSLSLIKFIFDNNVDIKQYILIHKLKFISNEILIMEEIIDQVLNYDYSHEIKKLINNNGINNFTNLILYNYFYICNMCDVEPLTFSNTDNL